MCIVSSMNSKNILIMYLVCVKGIMEWSEKGTEVTGITFCVDVREQIQVIILITQ